MRIGFVSGLSNHKLAQKLAPLQQLPEVGEILLFRRAPFHGPKVRWLAMPEACTRQPMAGDLTRLAQLLRHARHCHFLVGCHQQYHGLYAALAGRLLGIPVVQLVINDVDLVWPRTPFRWSLRHARGIALRGEASRALLLRRWSEAGYGPPPHTFLPPNTYYPAPAPPTAEQGFHLRDIDVVTVVGFAAYKNLPLLAAVLGEVKRRRGRLTARVVGDGPLEGLLQRELARHGVAADVTLPGRLGQTALAELFARSRVNLLTSDWEGLAMVVPEGFRCGAPAVVTEVGDMAELVRHGENGFLAPRGDRAALARGVLTLLEDPLLWQEMSTAARAAHARFTTASTLEAATARWRAALAAMGLLGSA